MSRLVANVLLAASTAALPATAQTSERLHFPQSGFSIAPFETAVPPSVHTPLMMFLPADAGFAANVNVQIQPFAGPLAQYLDVSRQQFEGAGVEVLQAELRSETEAVLEYTGNLQGNDLHWYARALHRPGRVYLVTATLEVSQWEEFAEQARRCVESFLLDDEPQGAQP